MPTQPLSFGLESRPGRFGPDGGAKIFNAYVEETAQDAKNPWSIYCRPGYSSFATLSGGKFRGALKLGALAYVVNGTAVDKVDSTGAVTQIGSFPGTSPVFMARNRKATPQIALASEGHRAIIESDVVSEITDTDLPAPIAVDFIGGRFVFALPDGRIFWSGIDNGLSYGALDFATAETNPDGLVGIIARTQEVVLFGTDSTEFWAHTGSSAVFEQVPQSTAQLGCLSGAAVKSINGIPIFPASDGTVRMLSGYDPERISTHDVERSIASLANKAEMTAQAFSLLGHHFYCLNAPTFTWVCDLLTRKWFQWHSYGLGRWRVEGSMDIDGKLIVGDYESPKLYQISLDDSTDAGSHLVWKMVSGPAGSYPNPIIADELYLDLLAGKGLNTTDEHAANPQVMCRTSDDDGYSWSDEMYQPVGKIGEFKREVSFLNMGASGEDGLRFEIAMSAPVARALMRAAVRYTPLAA